MDWAEKRVLVTGGAGFIGSHLVGKLLALGADVTCLDNFSPYYSDKEDNIASYSTQDRFHLVRADVTKVEQIRDQIKKSDLIFHLAAQPGVRYSVSHPAEVLYINGIGTWNVLETAFGADVERLILASSSSVYGSQERLPVDEERTAEPVSPYGVSKVMAENVCRYYIRRGIDIVILRFFTVYGPRQRPDMALHRFSKQILNGEAPEVFGDGTQRRDFTYVDDIIRGTIAACESSETKGEAFNLASGSTIELRSAISELSTRLIGRRVQPRFIPKQEGDVDNTWGDISKAKKFFRYTPSVSFASGIEKFANWFLSQQKHT